MKPEPRTAAASRKELMLAEEGYSTKRRKLSADERLLKNRERNKSHARKTRERKKNFLNALTSRISSLEEESANLRSKVDTRYTANVLLGLGGALTEGGSRESVRIRSSRSICKELDKLAEESEQDLKVQQKQAEEDQNFLLKRCTADVLSSANKRKGSVDSVSAATVERRAKGKYTPQERETIRRERNRIHAKKTRDRKKIFLEWSEKRISTLEAEVRSLRTYLLSTKAITPREVTALEDNDKIARFELAHLRETNASAMDTLLGIKTMASAVEDLEYDDNGAYFETLTSNSRGSSNSADGNSSGSELGARDCPNPDVVESSQRSRKARRNGGSDISDNSSRDLSGIHSSSNDHNSSRSDNRSSSSSSRSSSDGGSDEGARDNSTDAEQNSSKADSVFDDTATSRHRGWEALGVTGGSDNGDDGSRSGSTDGSTDHKSYVTEKNHSMKSLEIKPNRR